MELERGATWVWKKSTLSKIYSWFKTIASSYIYFFEFIYSFLALGCFSLFLSQVYNWIVYILLLLNSVDLGWILHFWAVYFISYQGIGSIHLVLFSPKGFNCSIFTIIQTCILHRAGCCIGILQCILILLHLFFPTCLHYISICS